MIAHELRRIFIHARWPVQSYVLAGFVFGLALARVPLSATAVLAFFSWLLLCAGLTVFNSYYDKEEDPVGGMSRPPKITDSLFYGSLAMEAVALAMAYIVGGLFFALAVIMAIVYFFYSHKSFRLKSNAFMAVFLNSVLGFMTILATGALSEQPFARVVLLGAITAAFYKASVYTMMQVHQIEEDKARGDTSIAVLFGRTRALEISSVCMVVAGAAGALTLAEATGHYLMPAVAAVYFGAMAILLLAWRRRDVDVARDTSTMTRMVHVTGYLACVMAVVVYGYMSQTGLVAIAG